MFRKSEMSEEYGGQRIRLSSIIYNMTSVGTLTINITIQAPNVSH
jgi:hypothetical protein